MKIWSMSQVLSQEKEEEKKNDFTQNDSLCICVPGEGVFIEGGIFREWKKVAKPQTYKGSILFIGSASKFVSPWILPPPPHDVTIVPSPMVVL